MDQCIKDVIITELRRQAEGMWLTFYSESRDEVGVDGTINIDKLAGKIAEAVSEFLER